VDDPKVDAAALAAIVGEAHVLVDAELRAGYEVDWTGRYHAPAAIVVRPGSRDEVAAVLAHCNEHRVAVVPQAGNTGLVGGSVPRPGGPRPVVLSTRRLDRITDLDVEALQVTAGAGTTIAAWQASARAAGLDTPVDFAARESATIGGAIATNAGGSRVVRYGTMRHQVVGVEAVLADGRVVGSLVGLPKETAGLHWPSLLAGSEGTLAVITAARLRLVPRHERVVTAMVALANVDDAVALAGTLRTELSSLDSLEIMLPAAVELVARHLGERAPVDPSGPVVIVECAAHVDPTDELATVLASTHGITDTAVATDPARRNHLVQFRDRVTEAIAAAAGADGIPTFKLDVAVPVHALGALLEVAERAARHDGAELIAFGHLAEGNLHLNHLHANDTARLADTVLTEVAGLGGTISAEHGIGVAKTPWLPLIRSAGDLAAQRSIRAALDPRGIMNPGVLASGPGAVQAP
jgi:FAD/FMN-containing dehydrogenase